MKLQLPRYCKRGWIDPHSPLRCWVLARQLAPSVGPLLQARGSSSGTWLQRSVNLLAFLQRGVVIKFVRFILNLVIIQGTRELMNRDHSPPPQHNV